MIYYPAIRYSLIAGLIWVSASSFAQSRYSAICSKPLHSLTIERESFLSYFDTLRYLPSAVIYSIRASQLNQELPIKRKGGYPSADEINILPSNAYSSTGYDHGHLAPARDFKHLEKAYQESMEMVNMSPQLPCFNQGIWCAVESAVREICLSHPDAELFVVSGPLWNEDPIDTLCLNQDVRVLVPWAYFKGVLVHYTDQRPDSSFAFIVPQDFDESKSYADFIYSVDSLEHVCKLDLFHFLADEREQKIEAFAMTIPTDIRSECGRKSCSAIMKNRVAPQNRLKKRCSEN